MLSVISAREYTNSVYAVYTSEKFSRRDLGEWRDIQIRLNRFHKVFIFRSLVYLNLWWRDAARRLPISELEELVECLPAMLIGNILNDRCGL